MFKVGSASGVQMLKWSEEQLFIDEIAAGFMLVLLLLSRSLKKSPDIYGIAIDSSLPQKSVQITLIPRIEV